MILADEGLNGFIVRELRNFGFVVDWIAEISPGILDIEVIEYAKNNNQILITEDKDFGEWVFAHQIEGLTIIFLRYQKIDFDQILNSIKLILPDLLTNKVSNQFVTINKNKIRKRVI